MHELALAQNICDSATAAAGPERRIVSVVVEVGPMCGVVPDALEYCFSAVARYSGMPDARLDLRMRNAPARCPACDRVFSVESMWELCTACGHGPVTVDGGRELLLTQVEVEDV